MHPDEGAVLLAVARGAIASSLDLPKGSSALQNAGASFVTLKQYGALRGCMGTLEPQRSLWEDVHANALAAAFRDPRFPPLTRDELAITQIEVSVLSESRALTAQTEAEALAQLQPNLHGVILEYERQRATFLPQVWQDFPDKRAFLEALKRKAGLAPNFWSPDIKIRVYTVEKWSELEAGEDWGRKSALALRKDA